MRKRDALIMANARRLILRKKLMTNAVMYMELFGTGFTTANSECAKLGLDPDSNATSYNAMCEHLNAEETKYQKSLKDHARSIPRDQ